MPASHSFTSLSAPADANRLPSGLKATLERRTGVHLDLPNLLAPAVPDAHAAVVAGRGEPTVRGVGEGRHAAGVAAQGVDGTVREDIPHLERAVEAGAGQELAVGAEGETGNRPFVDAGELQNLGVTEPMKVEPLRPAERSSLSLSRVASRASRSRVRSRRLSSKARWARLRSAA